MKLSIIKIGNSKGLISSKAIIDKYNIKDKFELILEKEQVILKPIDKPRKGWTAAFKNMHDCGDDNHLIDDGFEDEYL